MAGGADPSAVLDIIGDYVPPDAESGIPARRIAEGVVHALEVGGYRIVRAGMVPQLDALEHTVQVLNGVASLDVDAVIADAADARNTVRSLAELAIVVLGLDPADRDETDGTET